MLDFLQYHLVTILTVLVILLVVLVNHYGCNKNLQLAQMQQLRIDKLLKASFTNYDGEFVMESPNVIKVYASGRESCLFAILGYAMVPRQMIISFLFNTHFIRLKDQLVLQIPIKNQRPIPLTLAVVRKKNIRSITKKDYPDVKNLCKEYRPAVETVLNVPDSHSVLVEHVDHVKHVLHSEREALLWKHHGRSVKMLYLSDINKFSRYSMAVRMVINLGDDLPHLLEWLITFVDRMAKLKMTSNERRQAKRRRQGLTIKYGE